MEPRAIGVVEVSYYPNAVVLLDVMLKAAEVRLVSCQKRLGGKLVHMIVAGETSAVQAAVQAALGSGGQIGSKNLKVAVTISNPHPEIQKLLRL